MVVEGDPIAPTTDCDEILLTKLQEIGCSHEKAAQAISVCGRDATISELFDYIQASHYNVEDKDCAPKVQDYEDLEMQLKEMGYMQVHIMDALKTCGKQSNIFEIVDFIQAHYCDEDESCPKNNKVVEDDRIGLRVDARGSPSKQLQEMGCLRELRVESSESPSKQLQEMGCSCEQVANAISVCGKDTPVLDLFDFIQACQYPIGDVGCASKALAFEDCPEIQLKEMGFTQVHIRDALRACGTQSSILEIADFIQAHYCNEDATCTKNSEADSSTEDGDKVTTFSKLQSMGFTYAAIEKAINSYGGHDIEAILGFLFETEDLDFLAREDFQDEANGEETSAFGKCSSDSLLARASCEIGPSKSMECTTESMKFWSSYLDGGKDTINSFDSKESDDDFSESTWKGPKEKRFAKFNPYCSIFQKQERMMGFGIPGLSFERLRPLKNCMKGPPYFYFENVAIAPKNEWDTIERHFNGVQPEFVDSKFFSACRRQRGYVHNLPVHNRELILPTPPMTIFEALPHTQKYWPYWDTREKLNCITTSGSKLASCGLIRDTLSNYESSDIPDDVQQRILKECKKHNLIWVGPNLPAALGLNEKELLLGFDFDHTRVCSSMTDRYDGLGNSFQINTVAYHLSPLKSLYLKGITVLSLFSGIGGAEVALHKLGIFLKKVVVVEKNRKTRDIIVSWWKKSGQEGELISKYEDIKELTYDVLADLIANKVGKIDLIIGGSPCNNLSGNNRCSRTGLNGAESSLFFEFPRILKIVKDIMKERGYIL